MPGMANPILDHGAGRARVVRPARRDPARGRHLRRRRRRRTLAAAFKWFITPNVLLMTTLVLLRVDVARTLGHLRRPGRVAVLAGLQLLVCPVVAWAA